MKVGETLVKDLNLKFENIMELLEVLHDLLQKRTYEIRLENLNCRSKNVVI